MNQRVNRRNTFQCISKELEDKSEMILHGETNEELIKEVYARFGLAYYYSECLHRGLCHIYVFGSFLQPDDITRPRVEEKLAYAYSLTLGQVKDEIEGLIPGDLFRQLDEVVGKRNFLAHHFWFERCHLMFSRIGLKEIIEELGEYSDLFYRLDKVAEEYIMPKIRELGITDEMLQSCMEEIKSARPIESLPDKRKIKKQERIIKAWEFRLADGSKPLIFETDDGCFLQLCYVGLGWTYYDKIQPDWKENKIIRQYLPATINSRPKDFKPWRYEFEFARSAILWVRPGKRKRSFLWGIRIKQKKAE